jgi:isoaspartyl peptidase/L-asparaginase-like protein (Ntn-hydrolase superfamily)
LDAIVMDGFTMNAGAVGYLRRIRGAITAARRVMHYSTHTLLAGDGATNFSAMTGLPEQTLSSNASEVEYAQWQAAGCQPNFFTNFNGDNATCPPYAPIPTPAPTPMPPALTSARPFHRRHAVYSPGGEAGGVVTGSAYGPKRPNPNTSRTNHDTIGMCALDAAGNLAAGGSSNGADHKISGRLGDVPVVGAAVYADNEAGCAAGTGDGDVTMRFLPAYQAVEFMRGGMAPQEACEAAVRRVMRVYNTSAQIGLVCMSPDGEVGAAAQGWTFTYGVASRQTNNVSMTVQVTPLPPLPPRRERGRQT